MTSPEIPASRREVDQLRAEMLRLDDHGGRGVIALQVQMVDLIKDVTEMKTDMNTRFDAHAKVHEADEQRRIAGRRWVVGSVIGGTAAMATVIALLFDVLGHLH
jgi:hypothetical protein